MSCPLVTHNFDVDQNESLNEAKWPTIGGITT